MPTSLISKTVSASMKGLMNLMRTSTAFLHEVTPLLGELKEEIKGAALPLKGELVGAAKELQSSIKAWEDAVEEFKGLKINKKKVAKKAEAQPQ